MSAADMQYTVGPLVYVRISHKDNDMTVLHSDKGMLAKFREFCNRIGIINVGGGVSGPGIHVGYYTYIKPTNEPVERLSERIQTWLDEIGATAKQEW